MPYVTSFPPLARSTSRVLFLLMVPAVYIATPNCPAKARCITPSSAKPKTSLSCSFNLLWLFAYHMILLRSRESSVGLETGCMAEVPFPVGVIDFSLLHSIQTGSGAHPASYKIGYQAFFPRSGDVKLTTRLHLVLRS
jgi:hypothetical protein